MQKELQEKTEVWTELEKEEYKELIRRQFHKKYQTKVAAVKHVFILERQSLASQYQCVCKENQRLTTLTAKLSEIVLSGHYEFANDAISKDISTVATETNQKIQAKITQLKSQLEVKNSESQTLHQVLTKTLPENLALTSKVAELEILIQEIQHESKNILENTIKQQENKLKELQTFHKQMIRDFNVESKVKDTIQKQLKERCSRLERQLKKQTRPYHYPGQMNIENYSPESSKENNPTTDLRSATFFGLNSMKNLPIKEFDMLRPQSVTVFQQRGRAAVESEEHVSEQNQVKFTNAFLSQFNISSKGDALKRQKSIQCRNSTIRLTKSTQQLGITSLNKAKQPQSALNTLLAQNSRYLKSFLQKQINRKSSGQSTKVLTIVE